MFVKGKVESFTVLVDLSKASPWKLPLSLLKPFIAILASHFKCHTALMILLNASSLFTVAWKGISGLLKESLRKKTILVA